MSIASEITRINTNIANAYTACDSKGATMPASGSQNSANLATTISSIPVGSSGIPREVVNGVYQMPNTTSFTFSLPSNATNLGSYALAYAFRGCTRLTSVDLSSLTSMTGTNAMDYAFYGCSNLTSVDLSNLATVTKSMTYAFYNANLTGALDLSSLTIVDGYTTGNVSNIMTNAFSFNAITSVDLSNLTEVKGAYAMSKCFANNSNLTSINFANLELIGTGYGQFEQCFNGTSITTLTFPKLEKIYSNIGRTYRSTFCDNTTLQKLYFPALYYIDYEIFEGCTSLTEIHFGATNQSAIEATDYYSTLWGRGAGNATVYFDL